MRFPGFGGSRAEKSLRLIGPLGKEHKVEVVVRDGQLCLCAKEGQVFEALPLHGITWLPCALPGKDHCLLIQVASHRPRELLLKAASREGVLEVVSQLDAASQQQAQRSLQEAIQSQLEAAELQQAACQLEDELEEQGQQGQQAQHGADRPAGTVSFGSPEAQGGGMGEDDLEDCCSSPSQRRSSPGSAISTPRALSHSAAAAMLSPAGAAPEGGAGGEPVHLALTALPPVRLLSFSSKQEGRVATHVDQLERLVCQLSDEVASSRGNTPRARNARRELLSDLLASAPSSPTHQPSPTSPRFAQPPPASPRQHPRAAANLPRSLSPRPPAPAATRPLDTHSPSRALSRCQVPGSGAANTGVALACIDTCTDSTGYQVQTLLEENEELARQAAELQGALRAVRAQLELAVVNNVRLAREAAGAVRELQAVAGAAAAGKDREGQLQVCLEAAVQRCEEVGRELALLSGKLERRGAQCEELRRTVDQLSSEKTVLTAALTTAQLQLRDATPAGFSAQVAELQQASEAAAAEAGAARERAAAAERLAVGAQVRVADSQEREAEVAEHLQEAARLVEEARGARQAGLARECQLSAELERLRGQLGGYDQVEALVEERAGLLSQVSELQRVGEQLSASCAALEASLAQAVGERDTLRAALAQAQQAQQGAAQQWAAERAALERQLAGAAQALHSTEGSAHSSRAQAQGLQAQLDAARQELAEVRQRGASREAELQAELRLLGVKTEAEVRALRERLEGALGGQGAAAAAATEREAAVGAAQREAEAAQAEARRLHEEMRRLRDEHAVSSRGLQLEVSTLHAENARLAQEVAQAQAATSALRATLDAAQRDTQQAQSQLAAVARCQVGLSQERKELQARCDRLGVERDRAVRERDALDLRYASLQQQYRLLEAVAQEDLSFKAAAAAGVRCGGSKENGVAAEQQGAFVIKAARARQGGRQGVLVASASSSD